MFRTGILVILFLLDITAAGEIYDVTTLYYVGRIYDNADEKNTTEVHLGTNARGLPINYGGRVIDDATVGRHFPTCHYNFKENATNPFLWETEGWEVKYENSIFLDVQDIKIGRSSSSPSNIQPLPLNMEVLLQGYFSSEDYVDMFIFSQKTTLIRDLPHFFRIRYKPYQNLDEYHVYINYNVDDHKYRSIVDYCTIRDVISSTTQYDVDGQPLHYTCNEVESFEMHFDSSSSANNAFTLDFSNGRWQIWNDLKNEVLNSKRSPQMEAKYFSMYYSSNDYSLEASFKTGQASLTPITSNPLVSPWFTADMEHLCIAIVVNGFENVQVDLNITAENIEQNSFVVGSAKEFFQQKTWKVLHVTSPLPDQLKGSKIRLLLTPNRIDNFTIQRISSCNEDQDVAVIRTNELNTVNLNQSKAFDVNTITNHSDVTSWCSKSLLRKFYKGSNITLTSNGGCKIQLNFVCPPGFTGWQCERACGRNRYGADCKGVCSMYSYECQGLRLCTPAMGCHCAPGFSGEYCEEYCQPGKYGNDCDEDCGHCDNQGTCDIYTGHCVVCEPGYYPPYCKDTYPVLRNGPKVSTPSFGQAEVSYSISDYRGRGIPTMYQIQYRESNTGTKSWILQDSFYLTNVSTLSLKIVSNQSSSDDIASATIHGLDHGKFYEGRVVLFDDNFNSYQGDDVPNTRFLTQCTIPGEVDYNLASESKKTSLSISWDYKNTSAQWCPVLHFQVSRKEGWKWVRENTTNTSFTMSGLLSGVEILFKVRAYTSHGFAPYSPMIAVSTKFTVPGPVRSLSSKHKDKSELITWDPPENIGNETIHYHLNCKCLRRLGCASVCSPTDTLNDLVTSTNETLDSLLPFTQYLITVSAGAGPFTSVLLGTKMSLPTETVEPSILMPVQTNNSITVFWKPVEVCSGLIKGYIYQVYKAGDTSRILNKGFTKNSYVTVEGLSAKTEYIAQIFIENVVGWVADKYFLIKVSTSATVPEEVRNLTVYKKGRNLLGLRWEQPEKLYGALKSFTITYGYASENKTETLSPTPCIAWPHLYCHTLDNLRPNKRYTVSVAAKNAEVPEDGTSSSVMEITKEGIAGVPEKVKVVNKTSTSFAVSWTYPSLANGIIRSFVMSVEEMEQFEADKCCQIYPLVETAVKEELVNYNVEVSGLHPASTYTVSISAKTISFGPSVTMTIHTRPPSMPLQYLPKVSVMTQQKWTWLPQHLLDNFNNTELYQPLIKGNILLVVLNSTSSGFISGIEDEQLRAELMKFIQTDYYLAAEYFKVDSTVIGTGENIQTKWGKLSNPSLKEGQAYSFAAVQISEYCGVYNIDVVFSSTFIAVSQL